MITKEVLWPISKRIRIDDAIQEYLGYKCGQESDPIVASWREFEVQAGAGKVLVTPVGEKLFRGLPSLAKDFRNFKALVLATRFMPSYFKVVKYYGIVTILEKDSNLYKPYIIMERIFGPTLAEFVSTAQIYDRKFWGGVIDTANRTRQQFEDVVQKYTNIPPITLDMWNRKNQILDFSKPSSDVPFTIYAFDL